MHYIYILYSQSADRYYTGSTGDLEKRLEKHNLGGTASTRPYRPWEMVYTESFVTKAEALRRDNEIKRMKSRVYIESLIAERG